MCYDLIIYSVKMNIKLIALETTIYYVRENEYYKNGRFHVLSLLQQILNDKNSTWFELI